MDTIDITLPVSGKVVVIRNYTTKADDKSSDAALYVGVDMEKSEESDGKVTFPIANVMASSDVYVRRLVQSIDGDNQNIALRLEELRSLDYEAISQAVDKIVKDNSPKAKGVASASENDTSET